MSFKDRFRHLEGERPVRDKDARAQVSNRFGSLGEQQANDTERRAPGPRTEVAARFGPPPAPALLTACPLCALPAREGHESCHHCGASLRTSADANAPSVAQTVPAWRGEELPEDVAREIREKFAKIQAGAEGVDTLLERALEPLRQQRIRNLLLLFGTPLFMRFVIPAIATLLIALAMIALLVGGVIARGCSAVTGGYGP